MGFGVSYRVSGHGVTRTTVRNMITVNNLTPGSYYKFGVLPLSTPSDPFDTGRPEIPKALSIHDYICIGNTGVLRFVASAHYDIYCIF